jgi:hypothetical protein
VPLAGGRRHARPRATAQGPPPPGLRRHLTPVEAAAGFDPQGMAADMATLTDTLAGRWASVLRAQRGSLAAQVTAAIDDLDYATLAGLAAPDAGGPDLLAAAMIDAAHEAVRRVAGEAAAQGVHLDPARVAVDETRLVKIAQARAGLAGAYLAREAGRAGIRLALPGADPDRIGTDVETQLAGLSPVPLRDQLAAAIMAATNDGRAAALQADQADPATPAATYVASEVLDVNTCDPCLAADGTEFATLDEAMAAYPSGGYADCDGELRCRGTFIATWPDITITPPGG